jgi:hypothetical protein
MLLHRLFFLFFALVALFTIFWDNISSSVFVLLRMPKPKQESKKKTNNNDYESQYDQFILIESFG